jgi:hypothetical protein
MRNFMLSARSLLVVAAMIVPTAVFGAALTCNGSGGGDAPTGCIFDLYAATTPPFTLATYTFFQTSFTAVAGSEFVSFAFRETPAYFAFDDACVVNGAISSSNCATNSGNLLTSQGFEAPGTMFGQNCGHTPGTACPPDWGAWIQAVDLSAIGQIATNTDTYGCDVGAHSGTNFWCDGSVQGYDGIYQMLGGLTVGSTYNIGFWLEDDSGSPITPANTGGSNQIDMLVYAGTSLPVGTIPIGTPEPSMLALVGLGLAGIIIRSRRRRKA